MVLYERGIFSNLKNDFKFDIDIFGNDMLGWFSTESDS